MRIIFRMFLIRLTKTVLVGCLAGLLAIAALNNVLDYSSNFAFLTHVLTMDTTLRHELLMWRAVTSPVLHHGAYAVIVIWEGLAALLCTLGTIDLSRSITAPADRFYTAQKRAIVGLTASLVLWLGAFLAVGGEWFVMWQSTEWNGQDPAFRMFTVTLLTLMFLTQRE